MRTNTLRDVLGEYVQDLHSARTQLVRGLARMGRAAGNPDLKRAFEANWLRSHGQLGRLVRACGLLGIDPKGGTSPVMRTLIEQGQSIVDSENDVEARDAALIGAAQKMAHYAIAGYGTARTFAGVLGENEIAGLLQVTLDEEIAGDAILTEIASFELREDEDDDADDLDETDEYDVKRMVLVRR